MMGLLALIGSWGLFSGMETFRGNLFRGDRDMAVASLRRARSLAIDNICLGAGCIDGKSHGVHFDPEEKRIVIFQGVDFIGRNQAVDEIIKFGDSAVYVDSPFAFDIVFERLSGDSIARAAVLKDDRGHVSTISINSSGRIDWQ